MFVTGRPRNKDLNSACRTKPGGEFGFDGAMRTAYSGKHNLETKARYSRGVEVSFYEVHVGFVSFRTNQFESRSFEVSCSIHDLSRYFPRGRRHVQPDLVGEVAFRKLLV